MYRGTTRVSEKCIACYPRIEGKDPLTGGEPMETRCMAACVGKIRMQSLVRIGEDGLWAEDRWHPLYYTIRVEQVALPDRKSTRLNSSHSSISYAVFCLKKKKKENN